MFSIDNINYKPIKLRAEDDNDLEVLSKCLFEAICFDNEMIFIKETNTFFMSVERFTWECSESKDENLLQVLCIIQIHFVDSFIVENILDKKSKGLHSLTSIAYDENVLMFTFDQKASIRFSIKDLKLYIEDVRNPIKPAIVPIRNKG
mgnify:FL=1|jgi:hypothetical protein|tara:strand:+ start:207 stop:650 length:444 start_codon:yes stop_codon:yes gene_type:complete